MGKIVLLAQGQQIKTVAEELKRTLKKPENLEIKSANMDEAVQMAEAFDKDQVDVLIARGDTATMLQKSSQPFPVVAISVTDENIVDSISEAARMCQGKKPMIGIIGMGTFMDKVQSVFRVFSPDIHMYAIHSTREIHAAVTQARSDGMEVVVGGAMVCATAEQSGLKAARVGTTFALVKEAYEAAVRLQKSIIRERKNAEEINTIFNTVTDAILSIDERGTVKSANRRAREIWGIKSFGPLSITHLFDAEKQSLIRAVLEKNVTKTAVLTAVRAKNYSMSIYPVVVGAKNEGAIILLTGVTELQQNENKIRRNMYLKGNTAKYTFEDIKGASDPMLSALRLAKLFAPLQSNVLIIGQTGTGKELFAQSIHNGSDRSGGPFVAVNCGAIPENLIESELFGYVDGAFTGTKKGGKPGLFEIAHNGTIFLDEISEMNLTGQVRLLRVIQEQQVRRIGSDEVIPINVRIIAACNQNLKRLVEEKKFRRDLYYRLCVLILQIPDLKSRGADIGDLADYFMNEYNQKFGKNVRLTLAAKKHMETLDWDGNVRQLRNFCERICAVCPGTVADQEFVAENYISSYSFADLDPGGDTAPQENFPRTEQKKASDYPSSRGISPDLILRLMEEHGGNKTAVARELKISRTTLWKYLKELEGR